MIPAVHTFAGVAELADAQDLGSCTERCRGSTPLSCTCRRGSRIEDRGSRGNAVAILYLLSSILVLPPATRADTLWVGSGGGTGAIQIANAKITRVEKDQIYFLTSGREASRELGKVQRLNVDNEPALNAAEDAFAIGKFEQAVDLYQTVVRATNKPWIKDFSAARLLEAGNKSGRFDATAAAYVGLVLKDPAAAQQARPQIPATGRPPQLDAAVGAVNAAMGAAGATDEQRIALLTFLVDLHRARKDAAAEQQASVKLDELLAKDPRNPAAGQAVARRVLSSAQRALA